MNGTKKMPLIVPSDQEALLQINHDLHRNSTQMKPYDQTEELNRIREEVNKEFQPPMDAAIKELKEFARWLVKNFPEDEWDVRMRAAAANLHLEFQVKQPDITTYLNEAQVENNRPEKDSQVVKAGQPVLTPPTVSVLPGYVNKGRLHLMNAEQGIGKSTFCLGLFRALLSEQQTGQFLDLDVLTSKNWQLYLIGPDMSRDAWQEPLLNYGLGTVIWEGPEGTKWEPIPEVVLYPQETGASLSPQDIAQYRQLALDAQAEGKQALFVFDAYNTLLSNFMGEVDERTQKFAKPMRDLSKAMANTGATTIVLHHVSRTTGQSVAASGGGHNSLGSIPDVVVEMTAMGKNSDRMFIASAKRIAKTTLMVEQHYDEGRWECHGNAKDAAARKDLLEKIDSLRRPKDKIFELAEMRWEQQKLPFSTKNVEKWCDISPQNARLHIRVMESRGIFWQCDSEKNPGTYLPLYIPTEFKEEWIAAKRQRASGAYERLSTPENRGENTGKSTAPEAYERKECYERMNTNPSNGAEGEETAKSTAPEAYECLGSLGTQGTLGTLRNLTNAYGENVPSERQMVEDANGQNSMVVVELVPDTGEVKVQEFGNASAPIKTRRWLIDVFPCGTFAKNNPVVFDDDEEI